MPRCLSRLFIVLYRACVLAVVAFSVVVPTSAQTAFDPARMLHDVQVLSSDRFEGRRTGSAGSALAQAHIVGALRDAGVEPLGESYEQPFTFSGRDGSESHGVNLVGVIPGTERPGEYLVLSAHYDHLGVRDGEVYNGADDNASGTAGVLAMARYFAQHPLRHTLVVALFDAEEMGLRGARAFLDASPVPADSIVLNVNLDMVSRSPKRELYAVGTAAYPFLRPALDTLATPPGFSLLFGHEAPEATGSDNWTSASDHGVFHRAGIPFVYFGNEDHPGYHRPSDEYEAITPDFYLNSVEVIRRAVGALDEAADGFPER